jgi:hypothetical protein
VVWGGRSEMAALTRFIRRIRGIGKAVVALAGRHQVSLLLGFGVLKGLEDGCLAIVPLCGGLDQ